MLHVVTPAAHAVPDSVMRGMFAARKAVFVDLLKWNVPVLAGTYEIDQFDDEHARYLILTEADGRHLGSARLLPTTRPHILGDLFPELSEDGPPRGPGIFEITRFCLDRRLRAHERRAVRDTLITALAAHALDTGIRTYSAIAECTWLRQILMFGWDCRVLGVPRLLDGKMVGALAITIDAATPRRLADAGILSPSMRADPQPAAA